MTLKQGAMTASEYNIKFTSLLWVSEGMVPSDFDKAKKFEQGWRRELKTQVSILQFSTYTKVLDVIAEDGWINHELDRKGRDWAVINL